MLFSRTLRWTSVQWKLEVWLNQLPMLMKSIARNTVISSSRTSANILSMTGSKESVVFSVSPLIATLTLAGINFTNIIWVIFLFKSILYSFPQIAVGFLTFWQENIISKVACKTLVKLTTGRWPDLKLLPSRTVLIHLKILVM